VYKAVVNAELETLFITLPDFGIKAMPFLQLFSSKKQEFEVTL